MKLLAPLLVERSDVQPYRFVVHTAADMKLALLKYTSCLVLFCYSMLLVKPVMPVLADVIAHTFWEQEHILYVHEVNGAFHVHNEVSKGSKQTEKDKQNTNNKVEQSEYVHVSVKVLACPVKYDFIIQVHPLYSCYYPSSNPERDERPPIV